MRPSPNPLLERETMAPNGKQHAAHKRGALRAVKHTVSPAPRLLQRAKEIQAYGTVTQYPIGLSNDAKLYSVGVLNQILADTMTLRDLYKKHHWQLSGPTFYSLHLLFDKHYEEQVELVDELAERVQMLGGVAVAMADDVAQMSKIDRAPRGREELPVQLSRLLEAHSVLCEETRVAARRTADLEDDGTNDLLVSGVLRTNERQVWFISEHLVDTPLVLVK
jgi:starvation-inducible DNA-binding protein